MESIIGTWELCSIRLIYESGETVNPFGKNVKGLVLYQADGYMSGIISGDNRPPVTSQAMLGIEEAERASIAKNFIAYAGRYQVENDKVIHKVQVSFIPNLMSGQPHTSDFHLSGDYLIFTSLIQSTQNSAPESIEIKWKKARTTK